MSKFDELRRKLMAQDRTAKGNSGQFDNTVYPHWNLPTDGVSVLRFLPDGDDENAFFWVEKQMIRLPFAGIQGYDEDKEVTIQVPCMEMYGEQCPILNEIRPWFNTELDSIARQYWKKGTYLFQGFVQTDGINETETPENPIRRFVLTPQIFKVVKSALLDPEMENIPTDYVNGTDFRVTKTHNGKYAEYTTSSWSRKETPLTAEQLEAVEKFSLFNLTDFLPNRPTEEALEAIMEMFEASTNGQLYRPDKWANFYKPYGFNANPDGTGTSATTDTAAAVTETATPVVAETVVESTGDEEASTAPPGGSTADILARLKARQNT